MTISSGSADKRYAVDPRTGKTGFIAFGSRQENMPFHKGDLVYEESLGIGIVVGYSSISGEPFVFVYSQQQVLCIGSGEMEHVIDEARFLRQTPLKKMGVKRCSR